MHRATIALTLLLSACAASAKTSHAGKATLYSPAENGVSAAWSADEQARPAALRNLRRTPEASFHLLRVRTEQAARLHQGSALVLMALTGDLKVTVADRAFELSSGDVLEIPRGVPYALHNQADPASVAYLVFTPALAADDTKPADAAATQSAWQWNLWVQ